MARPEELSKGTKPTAEGPMWTKLHVNSEAQASEARAREQFATGQERPIGEVLGGLIDPDSSEAVPVHMRLLTDEQHKELVAERDRQLTAGDPEFRATVVRYRAGVEGMHPVNGNVEEVGRDLQKAAEEFDRRNS